MTRRTDAVQQWLDINPVYRVQAPGSSTNKSSLEQTNTSKTIPSADERLSANSEENPFCDSSRSQASRNDIRIQRKSKNSREQMNGDRYRKNSKAATSKKCCACSPSCIGLSLLFGALIMATIAAMLVGILTSRRQTSTDMTTSKISFVPNNIHPKITTSTISILSTMTMLTSTTTTVPISTTTTTVLISSTTVATTMSTTTTIITTTITSTTATTTARPVVNITAVSDFIVAVFNTSAGRSTGGFNGTFISAEDADNAIDGLLSTKYINFGFRGTSSPIVKDPGIGTGFIITPRRSNASVATALQFATANDFPERDPLTVTLEVANVTGIAALNSGASWTLIYNGSTGIDPNTPPPRSTHVARQNFSNTIAYRSYRLLITSQRNQSNSVQYAEATIMGYL